MGGLAASFYDVWETWAEIPEDDDEEGSGFAGGWQILREGGVTVAGGASSCMDKCVTSNDVYIEKWRNNLRMSQEHLTRNGWLGEEKEYPYHFWSCCCVQQHCGHGSSRFGSIWLAYNCRCLCQRCSCGLQKG